MIEFRLRLFTFVTVILLAVVSSFWLFGQYQSSKEIQSRKLQETKASEMIRRAMHMRAHLPLKKFPSTEDIFSPYTIAENNHVALANINRIMAHAALIGLNASAMAANGNAGPRTHGYAMEVASLAIEQQKRLAKRLNEDPEWTTAFTNRKQNSNILFKTNQTPAGYPGLLKKLICHGENSKEYFVGYEKLRLANLPHTYSFVPLQSGTLSTLIGKEEFKKNIYPGDDSISIEGSPPVPNSYGSKSQPFIYARAGNPVGDYQASILGGFIRIENLTGRGCAPAEFFAQEPKAPSILDQMRQRIREISPDFDFADDHSETRALLNESFLAPQQRAYIYCDYTKNENIILRDEKAALKSHLANYVSMDPDGKPNSVQGSKYTFEFIPACGICNLLGVLRIKQGIHSDAG
ncbi:MAG: hypothetical protein K2W82_06750 [Candidatus Obscuribacterales bacterium]|jgi:hypothetical protein|nr:hypothetical protein [Candidatus Obscuribacterales bacterium]